MSDESTHVGQDSSCHHETPPRASGQQPPISPLSTLTTGAPTDAHALSIGQCATLACLLEVTATKPGNVHRGADFEDATYLDFVLSSMLIAPVFDAAGGQCIGRTVLDAVRATRAAVGKNTNLGMLLLLAPLAAVPRGQTLREGVAAVLASLGHDDARLVYEAIRVASPGGLGRAEQADVASDPPADLVSAMRLAADRDLVARQYTNDFADVFESFVPWLSEAVDRGWPLSAAIVHAHLRGMSTWPDSLIARKCGIGAAQLAGKLASEVLAAGQPGDEEYERALSDLDFWLRSDGHRRNPGTTADLVAAALFVVLREGRLGWPIRFYS